MAEDSISYFVRYFSKNEMIDITSSWEFAISKRGESGFQRFSYQQSPDETNIRLSPQSITHIDLPWHIEKEQIGKFMDEDLPSFGSKEAEELIKKNYLKTAGICKIPSIIIDMSTICKEFKNFLLNPSNHIYVGDEPEKEIMIDPYEAEDLQEKILDILKISQNRIKELFNSIKNINLKDKPIIIFKTSWLNYDGFRPKIKNLSNPIWEGIHPFLMNPYLTQDTVDYLIKLDIIGLGCDAIELENPISYFVDQYTLPHLLKLKNKLLNQGIEPFYLHKKFLSCGKILLENLDLSSVLITVDHNLIEGWLYIFPLRSTVFADALICKAFFKPGLQ